MLRNLHCRCPDPAENRRTHPQRSGYSLDSSLWMSSAKLGSSPHQKSQSSLRPGVWCLLQTLSTSAAMHRLKLHRMGSSSVTGKRMGEDVGPCHTKRLHFIPVKSACRGRERIWWITNPTLITSSWLYKQNGCAFSFPQSTKKTKTQFLIQFKLRHLKLAEVLGPFAMSCLQYMWSHSSSWKQRNRARTSSPDGLSKMLQTDLTTFGKQF